METDQSFAARIRERYPAGLTGVISIGGTRTTYILEKNRHKQNPGHIEDFDSYADFLLKAYFDFIAIFFELGGQNIIMPILSYQSFSERGEEYSEMISCTCGNLTNGFAQTYYKTANVDPYFVGIDTLLQLSVDHPGYGLGVQLNDFQKSWTYGANRRKVIWEVAPIPLFSIWRLFQSLDGESRTRLDNLLANTRDMESMHGLLYPFISKILYGTELPEPHFYLGSNRNGDFKLRSMLPIALLCGSPFRLFYTPYPSLFMKRNVFRAMLEDLAFGEEGLRSKQKDYANQFTSELAELAYQHFSSLSMDPSNIAGLSQTIKLSNPKA